MEEEEEEQHLSLSDRADLHRATSEAHWHATQTAVASTRTSPHQEFFLQEKVWKIQPRLPTASTAEPSQASSPLQQGVLDEEHAGSQAIPSLQSPPQLQQRAQVGSAFYLGHHFPSCNQVVYLQ